MYFLKIYNNNQGSIYYNPKDFVFIEVDPEEICGYRALDLRLYRKKNFGNVTRKDLYKYPLLNKSNFTLF